LLNAGIITSRKTTSQQ